MSTDQVADMLTRIRNAAILGRTEVEVPYSNFKAAVADILQQTGYVDSVETTGEVFKVLKLTLSKVGDQPKVKALARLSRPGRRLYAKAGQIPRPLSGRGLVIVSTSSGVMSGAEAKQKGLGGELICKVE